MAKRWLCLHLPWLSSERVERLKPWLRHKPFALVEKVAETLKVRALSRAAHDGGIRAGMKFASARAALPELVAVDHDPRADREALEALAEWSIRLGPGCAIYESRETFAALATEISGGSHLFGGELRFIHAARRGLTRLGYLPSLAIADTPRASHALAQVTSGRPVVAPVGATNVTCATLPLHTLMLADRTLESLEALGIRSVGQLLKLPRSTLPARFGDELPRRIAELLGEVEELPQPVSIRHEIAERMEFEDPLEDGEGLRFTVKRLADRVAERLAGSLTGARELLLTLTDEDTRSTVMPVNAAQPTANAKGLLLLIMAGLERLEFPGAISAVELRVVKREVLSNRYQSLFEAKSQRDPEALSELLDRLSARIGIAAVARAELREDYRPEKAWEPLPFLSAGKARAVTTKAKAKRPAWRDYDGQLFHEEDEAAEFGEAALAQTQGAGGEAQPLAEILPLWRGREEKNIYHRGHEEHEGREEEKRKFEFEEEEETMEVAARVPRAEEQPKVGGPGGEQPLVGGAGAFGELDASGRFGGRPPYLASSCAEQPLNGRSPTLGELFPLPMKNEEAQAGLPALLPPIPPTPRPTRLLLEPRPIEVETHQGIPVSIGGQRVIDCQGPERIATAWWERGASRDYYSVLLPSGERLWVAQNLGTREFEVHGLWG